MKITMSLNEITSYLKILESISGPITEAFQVEDVDATLSRHLYDSALQRSHDMCPSQGDIQLVRRSVRADGVPEYEIEYSESGVLGVLDLFGQLAPPLQMIVKGIVDIIPLYKEFNVGMMELLKKPTTISEEQLERDAEYVRYYENEVLTEENSVGPGPVDEE